MTATDLQAWIDNRGLSQRGAAKALDISVNRLKRFLAGESHIPGHIGLACSAIVFGLPGWRNVK